MTIKHMVGASAVADMMSILPLVVIAVFIVRIEKSIKTGSDSGGEDSGGAGLPDGSVRYPTPHSPRSEPDLTISATATDNPTILPNQTTSPDYEGKRAQNIMMLRITSQRDERHS
ncbi:hypothetical protein GE21DRAFT_5977 [Neurospora crassa]|uniref:Uncharacterized protein n=1 Tax=Neurospora crassa (strain ATCC 24698 / 74-OR23-1A / CBS 708.71 / DSM 1257 / FGSC 987) TaxID=367110 RepID=Q7RY39_NEUCR|nr:hypothetical protein NCU04524 [Neurospora crassa OR74A]EAA27699.1 hypothetical protein NCU04524 [Neurospora crassa OR74A]KHE79463.1 hypothetical protein GE21DRAFT_5977 [Neurospora crassa]|eukprot:XP_956935.1 hypothetical protein NCU04524 [Neurospora crassa OR74A]